MSFIYKIKFIHCIIAVLVACFSVLFGFLLAWFIRCRYGKKWINGDRDLLLAEPPKQIQHFSFPNPIIRYVAMNPTTPNCSKKLIRSCKYFSTKNPIIIVSELPFIPLIFPSLPFSKPKPLGNKIMESVKGSKSCHKIWITKAIYSFPFQITNLIPKLYKCEITKLILRKQNMSFNDFLILTRNVKKLLFENVVVKYSNGKIVMFEEIIENLPVLEKIIYKSNSHDISKKTVENLLEISHLQNLSEFVLKDIPEVFDFVTFSTFITDNCKNIQFVLDFDDHLSDVYKQNIINFITDFESNKSGSDNYHHPFIIYDDIIWGNEADDLDWDESDDDDD